MDTWTVSMEIDDLRGVGFPMACRWLTGRAWGTASQCAKVRELGGLWSLEESWGKGWGKRERRGDRYE